jgi:Fe-S cluster assembly protein SufD
MIELVKNHPAWLSELKGRAWEAYQDLPLPDRVTHLYSAVGIAVNGWTHRADLPKRLSDAGVILKDLNRAVTEDEELVESYLARLVPGDESKFEALNLAAWHGGFFLYVPRDVQVADTMHLFLNDDGVAPFCASRILVVMEPGSSMTLFTEYTSRNGNGRNDRQVNTAVELVLGKASSLRHVTVQRLSRNTNTFLTARGRLERDARLLSVISAFGGGTAKMDTGTILAGEGAESDLVGFAFGEARQRLDHHVGYDHRAPHTRSNLNFKVVLKGRARSAFTGMLRIAADAPFCEAYQENRNILLSDRTQADTIPELEILTDEVRCSHGATVGPIDPEHVFYLMSRGIPQDEAVRIVVGGFLEPTLARIPGDLQERVRRCVDERLREF